MIKVGVIMRYSFMDETVKLYDMSTNCSLLKRRTKELNDRPSYTHPFEGHLFKYYYAYKFIKEEEIW